MKKVPAASPGTRTAYSEIVSVLGAEDGAMFGMPTMKSGGKGFAGLFGDAMVFKLTGDAHTRALALKGAELFDPSGAGRAMKEWVVVPKSHTNEWQGLAASALAYVGGGAKASAAKAEAEKPAKTKAAKTTAGGNTKAAGKTKASAKTKASPKTKGASATKKRAAKGTATKKKR